MVVEPITFDLLVKSVQALSFEQKRKLVQSLQLPILRWEPTRTMLIAELESLRAAGAFSNIESMRNKYACPDLIDNDQNLLDEIHLYANAWEKELDEFFDINH